jgi:hypothetical protein
LRVLQTAAPPAPIDKPAAAKPAAGKDIDHVPLVLEELRTKKKVCIAQTAPAVRIAIGEELGLGPGVNATGKMVSGRVGTRCCSLQAPQALMVNPRLPGSNAHIDFLL